MVGVERILAATEVDYTARSVTYIQDGIVRFQRSRPGNFVLGISGTNGEVRRGRAKDVFALLGEREGIDWQRVIVFLVDERYGYENEDECNASLVQNSLIARLASRGVDLRPRGDWFVVPDTSLGSCEACAADYEARLCELFEREGPPHLVTLSLASDLSVGSIFPEWYHAEPQRWAQATERRYAVLCTETTHFEVKRRICVNLRVVRAAENIVIFLGGKDALEDWKRSSSHGLERKAPQRLRMQRSTTFASPVAAGVTGQLVKHLSKRFSMPLVGGAAGGAAGYPTYGAATPSERPRWCSAPSQDLSLGAQEAARSTPHTMERHQVSISEFVGAAAQDDAPPPSPISYVTKYSYVCVVQLCQDDENHTTLVVFGAAGDLAKKKTFPAIFHLHLSRVLPTNLSVVCCDDVAYHVDIKDTNDLWNHRLQKYLAPEGKATDLDEFRKHLEFVPIKLNDPAVMKALDGRIKDLAGGMRDHRIFYLAQPPFLFEASVKAIREQCWSEPQGSVRVIVEKPFGRDLESARELSTKLAAHLGERQIYRIDHYLAKTTVLNILTLRFANRELGRLFHSDNVANVRITFKEDIGVEGRAGYFDNYGIIRDVMQNHLLQLLTLVCMEAPATLGAEDVRDEKVKVLKQIRAVEFDDCAVGQYAGYQDDPDILKVNEKKGYTSKCPTFAACVLYLDNERWSGVPLILKAGKHLEARSTIVRLQFKKAPPNSLFGGDQPQNELVMRIQPNEAIYYRIMAKTPGLSSRTHEVRRTKMDLDLRQLDVGRPPEAYEKLIHDVIQGEGHNFVRADEVEEGWRIFDPVLRELESPEAPVPPPYAAGGRGPEDADKLINSTGFRRYTKTGVPGYAEDDFG